MPLNWFGTNISNSFVYRRYLNVRQLITSTYLLGGYLGLENPPSRTLIRIEMQPCRDDIEAKVLEFRNRENPSIYPRTYLNSVRSKSIPTLKIHNSEAPKEVLDQIKVLKAGLVQFSIIVYSSAGVFLKSGQFYGSRNS